MTENNSVVQQGKIERCEIRKIVKSDFTEIISKD